MPKFAKRSATNEVKSRTTGPARRGILAGLVATAVLTTVLAATAPAAHAEEDVRLSAGNSSLYIDVPGGSTSPGTGIIQWYANSGQNQLWTVPEANYAGFVSNANSGLCIATDGVAGDQLTQQYCNRNDPHQIWAQFSWSNWFNTYQWFQNPVTGLVFDIYGSSQWAGAPLDAWYPNGGANQSFVAYGY